MDGVRGMKVAEWGEGGGVWGRVARVGNWLFVIMSLSLCVCCAAAVDI